MMFCARKSSGVRTLSKVSICLCSAVCALLYSESALASVERHLVSLESDTATTFILAHPADGISATLQGDEKVYLQLLENGRWSQWHLLERDTDASPYERESQLLVTDDATEVRLWSDADTTVTLHGIAVADEPISHLEASARKLQVNMMITRAEWGANESLRLSKKPGSRAVQRLEDSEINIADAAKYCDLRARLYPEEFREVHAKFSTDEGKTLYWPQGYSKDVHLFVVHHTAESKAAAAKRTGVERMRMLYEYHTVSRKWGDIGYNFVIDPEGNIYEGRAGGPYVVGAHTMCNNVGTIGIALMGNFQDTEPPDSQLTALRMLLVQLSDEYGVDPTGRTMHHGKLYPTIIGHRDLRPTACPGGQSYALFPQVRLAVKNRDIAAPLYSPIVVASNTPEAQLLTGIDGPLSLEMGERRSFSLKYRNTGSDTWRGGSWLLGEARGGVYFSHFPPSSFVAGVMQEKEVPPGGVGTFTVELQGGLTQMKGAVTLTPVINNIRRLAQSGVTEEFAINPGSARFTPVVTSFPPLHTTGEDLTGTMKILNSGTVHWERDTITELHFLMKDGKGDVSILKQPSRIGPGEQGTFEVRFHDVTEQGAYSRTLVPVFGDGTPLVGSTITVASRAEPLPAVALASSSPQTLAQSIEMYRRGRVTGVINDITIEALIGTELTLYQGEQISIPLRMRAGENGTSRGEAIAAVALSDPSIIVRDERRLRLRDVFRAPASLLAFQAYDTDLQLVAPRHSGDYTMKLGDIEFTITVTSNARSLLERLPPRQISRRSVFTEERIEQMRQRRARHAAYAATRAKSETKSIDPLIRIRIGSDKNSTLLTAPGTLRIEGDGRVIETKASGIQAERWENQCHVSSADGDITGDVIRITPMTTGAPLTIVALERKTNRYRGTLECRILDGKLVWINELPLEQYIAGLAEEPDTEPYEKQRAFAIAARSYALYYTISGQRKFPGLPYDGSDSPREFQAYGGVAFEEQNPKWVEATQATAGKVLTWQRRVIKAPYFSTDSGTTKSAFDVWGWQDTPYLDAKEDPWCLNMVASGHGVGMSGCGAEGQANEGKSAETILNYYYPGAKILPINSIER